MKTVLLLAILTISSSAFASDEVSRIQERGSQRVLTYSRDNNNLIFALDNGYNIKEIKRLNVNIINNVLEILGDADVYHLNIFYSLGVAAIGSYDWCFTDQRFNNNFESDFVRWLTGMRAPAFFSLATPITFPLCVTLPGIPLILGAILIPVDGLIEFGDRLLDPDAVAARKFSKLLRGKNKKASRRVFESLIRQIKKL